MMKKGHDANKLLSQGCDSLKDHILPHKPKAVEIAICSHISREGFDLMKDTRKSELCKAWDPSFAGTADLETSFVQV